MPLLLLNVVEEPKKTMIQVAVHDVFDASYDRTSFASNAGPNGYVFWVASTIDGELCEMNAEHLTDDAVSVGGVLERSSS